MLLAASLVLPSSFLLELAIEMTMVRAKENRELHFPASFILRKASESDEVTGGLFKGD